MLGEKMLVEFPEYVKGENVRGENVRGENIW